MAIIRILKDRTGRRIGQLEGKWVKNRQGVILGWFDGSYTYDRRGYRIGAGDLRTSLLP